VVTAQRCRGARQPRLMHPIWPARIDKTRPVLLLTREEVSTVRGLVTIAPITSTNHGLRSEIPSAPATDSTTRASSISTPSRRCHATP
jgi:mRNA interferase MazF